MSLKLSVTHNSQPHFNHISICVHVVISISIETVDLIVEAVPTDGTVGMVTVDLNIRIENRNLTPALEDRTSDDFQTLLQTVRYFFQKFIEYYVKLINYNAW